MDIICLFEDKTADDEEREGMTDKENKEAFVAELRNLADTYGYCLKQVGQRNNMVKYLTRERAFILEQFKKIRKDANR